VIVSAAVQNTGYGHEVAPVGYPAVADAALVIALSQAASQQQQTAHTGIVLTRDAFFNGVINANTPDYRLMSQANVLAVEMECAALFLIGSLRRVPTAAILAVDGFVLKQAENMDSFGELVVEKKTAIATAIDIAIQTFTKETGLTD
jgi:uridine phosphorylase